MEVAKYSYCILLGNHMRTQQSLSDIRHQQMSVCEKQYRAENPVRVCVSGGFSVCMDAILDDE